jgi:hypothetical protein
MNMRREATLWSITVSAAVATGLAVIWAAIALAFSQPNRAPLYFAVAAYRQNDYSADSVDVVRLEPLDPGLEQEAAVEDKARSKITPEAEYNLKAVNQAASAVASSTPTPTPTPTDTELPKAASPTYTLNPNSTGTPASTNTPNPTNTPASTNTPNPTNTPASTNTPNPTNTPASTNTPRSTNTPKPTKTPQLSTRQPTDVPDATQKPKPTSRPRPTQKPKPTKKPSPTKKPHSNNLSSPTEIYNLVELHNLIETPGPAVAQNSVPGYGYAYQTTRPQTKNGLETITKELPRFWGVYLLCICLACLGKRWRAPGG